MAAAIVVVGTLTRKRRPVSANASQSAPAYRAAPSLLTPTEAAFLPALMAATGTRAAVFMKVRLADILLAPRNDFASFRRVSQKHVDFLLCHPRTFAPLVVVELDDRSHDRNDRRARDGFVDAACRSAGVGIVHIPVGPQYDPSQISGLIRPHLPPEAQ